MRFWDSSGVVPLTCLEAQSGRCESWLREDPLVIVWALAGTEVLSALARKRRDGSLDEPGMVEAKRRLAALERSWTEVGQLEPVRDRARRLLETHSLSAADALHLAAALTALGDRRSATDFVTFDRRLAEAAEKEGFHVLTGE